MTNKRMFTVVNVFRLLLICHVTLICSAKASKVLVIPPTTYSHCGEVSAIGQELVERGHNVSILLSTTFVHRNCHVRGVKQMTPIWLTLKEGIEPTGNMTRAITKTLVDGDNFSFIQRLDIMKIIVDNICGNALSNKEAIEALKEEQYDLVILNGAFVNYCCFVIPYFLNVPYVAVSTMFEDIVSGRPFLPSTFPEMSPVHTESLTFLQRLNNVLSQIAFHAMAQYLIPMDLVSTIAPQLSRQDVVNLVSNSQLFLYNYDTVLGYPLPQMPNHVHIGGIGIKEAKPLNGEIAEYYKDSVDGVVLVTFGGNDMDLPKSKVKVLLRVFQKLKLNVVWKYGTEAHNGNVKQMKWVPQNDLLSHPNTKLFVSHCGNNGVFEALYHGVPLVCTPIITDQFYNGARVKHWQVGVSVPLLSSPEETIYNAIMEVLSNPKFKQNMQRASGMYRSRPDTPRQRAGNAIENVLRFGGEHLRSRAPDMWLFTYMGYDLVCFVLAVILCSNFILLKCIQSLCKHGQKRKPKEKKN